MSELSLSQYQVGIQQTVASLPVVALESFVELLTQTYKNGAKVIIAGNGGSAATASHMACDFMKTTLGKTNTGQLRPLRAIALTDSLPAITAWGNDTSYDVVFSEQLRALADEGDILVVISASGNSPNILKALEVAHSLKLKTVALLGFGGGKAKAKAKLPIIVDSAHYGIIEDAHGIIMHMVTDRLKVVVQGR